MNEILRTNISRVHLWKASELYLNLGFHPTELGGRIKAKFILVFVGQDGHIGVPSSDDKRGIFVLHI